MLETYRFGGLLIYSQVSERYPRCKSRSKITGSTRPAALKSLASSDCAPQLQIPGVARDHQSKNIGCNSTQHARRTLRSFRSSSAQSPRISSTRGQRRLSGLLSPYASQFIKELKARYPCRFSPTYPTICVDQHTCHPRGFRTLAPCRDLPLFLSATPSTQRREVECVPTIRTRHTPLSTPESRFAAEIKRLRRRPYLARSRHQRIRAISPPCWTRRKGD